MTTSSTSLPSRNGQARGVPVWVRSISPRRAGIIVVLLSDSTRMAERLKAAGVEVKLEVWPGMFHAFPGAPQFLPEARLATQHIVKFIRRHMEV